MNKIPPFILASRSKTRLALLKNIGYTPDLIKSADIDETPLRDEIPSNYVKRVAAHKVEVIKDEMPQAIIIGADTVVCVGRRIIQKATTDQEQAAVLQLLSGRRHRVLTAVAFYNGLHAPLVRVKLFQAHVAFKHLSKAEIECYVLSKEWWGKSGYAMEGLAATFIRQINGAPSTISGLPLCPVHTFLWNAGLRSSLCASTHQAISAL